MSLKFTAARARNEGFKKIKQLYPNVDYVHFLDGDCSVHQDWVNKALAFIVSHPAVAVVCGRRRERYPHVSAYNRMCDIEWDTPIGEAKACGGDALISTKVFHQVGGFKQDLIAGEEPELCIRIRQSGYKIWRLDGEMTSHDASILHFAQWWKRTMRAGYAFAEGSQLHGHAPEYHWVKESMRAWFWGAFMPMLWLVGLVFYPLLAWLIVFIFMLQLIKLIYKNKKFGDFSPKYASYTLLGKVAEVCGQIKYYWHHVLRSQSKIIEYK